jgi:hypothetical protein
MRRLNEAEEFDYVFGFAYVDGKVQPVAYDETDKYTKNYLFILAPDGTDGLWGMWYDYTWRDIMVDPAWYLVIRDDDERDPNVVDCIEIKGPSDIDWCTEPVLAKDLSYQQAEELMEMWFYRN